MESISNLGHIISVAGHGPSQGPSGVEVPGAMLGMCRPKLGYYRKFIHDYGAIAVPFNALLKEGFLWSKEATEAFNALKTTITIALILVLLSRSTASFAVECDASTHGIDTILLQDKHLITFFSRPVAP